MGYEVLGTLAVSGILTALSVYLFILLFFTPLHNLRKVCGYHLWIDAAFSILLVIVYAGTFSGMVTAFFGGLTLSILLYLTKKWAGYARLQREGVRFHWLYYPGWY